MDRQELDEILANHRDWFYGRGGERAYLRGADLQGADLQGADLQGADLQGADLRGADLQGADLQGADLQGAKLQKTIFDGINWLAYIGIVPDHQGTARAYKLITRDGVGPFNGGINYLKESTFSVPDMDDDVNTLCSRGINLATFQWCLNNKQSDDNRLLMFSFNVKDAVCPIASDGKFRVRKCRKIGECDWQGNLMAESKVTEGGSPGK